MANRRAVRAATEAALLGTTYLAVGGVLLRSGACVSRQTAPYPCLGGALLFVAVGVPLVTLGVAWALRGKGALHSLVGAVVCVAGSLLVQARVSESGLVELSDLAAGVLIVVTGAIGVWLWAVLAPGR
jgi:hypothetical protein